MGNTAFPRYHSFRPQGRNFSEPPTPPSTSLPRVSSLNFLSHLDLHILTNPSRLERSICSLPTLWKTRPKTNISSVHGCCGMSEKVSSAQSLPHPIPPGKVVWRELSRSGRWERCTAQCGILSFSSSSSLAAQQHLTLLPEVSSLCFCFPPTSSHLAGCSPFSSEHPKFSPWPSGSFPSPFNPVENPPDSSFRYHL